MFSFFLLFVYCPPFVATLILHYKYKRFADGKIWCSTINYSLLACYRWKQNWKITSVTDFIAFHAKALFQWYEFPKNANISILSNFQAVSFWDVFSISRNFTKYNLHANFRSIGPFKQKLQRGQFLSPSPRAIPICKKPSLFRVKEIPGLPSELFLKSIWRVTKSFKFEFFLTLQSYSWRIHSKLDFWWYCT